MANRFTLWLKTKFGVSLSEEEVQKHAQNYELRREWEELRATEKAEQARGRR